MSEIAFYTNPQSRGQIVHWLLEELDVAYDTQWIEYGEQMKSSDYLAINPMGKVPAITHRGAVVTEVAAICLYLAAVYPEQGLIPKAGSAELASYYRWMLFAAGPLEMATTVKSIGWESTPEQSRMLGFGSYGDTLAALELALREGPHICGEQFTAVDVYLGAALNWGIQFGTIEKRPVFDEYATRLQRRPAAQRAVQINEERMHRDGS